MKLRLLCESDKNYDEWFLKDTFWHVSILLYNLDKVRLPFIKNKDKQFDIISSLWSTCSYNKGLNIEQRYDKIIKILSRIRLTTWIEIHNWPGLLILPHKEDSFHDEDEFYNYLWDDHVKVIVSNNGIEFCSKTKDECYQHTLSPYVVSTLQHKIKVIEKSLKDTLDTFVKNYTTR